MNKIFQIKEGDSVEVMILKHHPQVLLNYLRWYAEQVVGDTSSNIEWYLPTSLDTFKEIVCNYFPLCRKNPTLYQDAHEKFDVKADYMHVDREAGRGELGKHVIHSWYEGSSERYAQLAPDYAQEGELVYSETVVPITPNLVHRFSTYMHEKGCKLNGDVLPPADFITDVPGVPDNTSSIFDDKTQPQATITKVDDGLHTNSYVSIQQDTAVDQPTNPIKETPIMSQTQRRIVNIALMDNDGAILEASDAHVKSWNGVVTQDDDATTIQELIMTKDVAAAVKAHNTKRETLTDEDILKSTGQYVKLRAVKLKDLTWIVSPA